VGAETVDAYGQGAGARGKARFGREKRVEGSWPKVRAADKLRLVIRRVICLLALLLICVASDTAQAKSRGVKWTKVDVPTGQYSRRVSHRLRRLLEKATKRVKWGSGDPLKLKARVTKLTWEKSEDVLRVTVTVVARIEGGKGARSHIRVGGRPRERTKLERQALKIVADGLVTRLSSLSRD